MAPQIETAEISDADLDGVSGGVGASLPGGLAGVDVTPTAGGVAASVSSGAPGLGGVNGTLNAGVPHVENATGIVG
ncbi:type A2 lantipeptide [Streptomyces sp. HNM0575]|uniref:type A2 lantipeptide n=1 Tax=Streptomyces sp. HNM0575 TaxID=2716338 RepID=UPI0019CFE92A|nr:type A2 lantipeptide [Streptomyces sp. HNM0575]